MGASESELQAAIAVSVAVVADSVVRVDDIGTDTDEAEASVTVVVVTSLEVVELVLTLAAAVRRVDRVQMVAVAAAAGAAAVAVAERLVEVTLLPAAPAATLEAAFAVAATQGKATIVLTAGPAGAHRSMPAGTLLTLFSAVTAIKSATTDSAADEAAVMAVVEDEWLQNAFVLSLKCRCSKNAFVLICRHRRKPIDSSP